MIIPLDLTSDQFFRISNMINELMPEVTRVDLNMGGLLRIRPKEPRQQAIHWFEFCFRFLAPKVAEAYTKHHVGSTESFAKYMILQKLAHELNKTHSVDLLYDIWKHPQNYRVDL